MKAERSFDVQASASTMLAVLTDFERYPEFIPELTRVRTLAREQSAWEVSFELLLVRPLRYTLRLLLSQQSESETQLSWSLVEGSLRSVNGAWTVQESTAAQCTVRCVMDVQTGSALPAPLRNSLQGELFDALMAQIRTRAESLAAQA